MDLGMLSVKFHFGGQFDDDGYSLNYNGGRVEMSEIDRDKVSLPELRGFLADHISLGNEDSVVFYWLFPGGTITNGLRKLVNDKDCMHMCECINDGGVVDVYAEIYKQQGGDDVVLSASLPSSVMKAAQDGDEQDGENNESHDEDSEEADSDDSDEGEAVVEEDDNDSEDSDYIQGDEDTTEDDEGATQFRANARNQRRNPFATAAAPCKLLESSGSQQQPNNKKVGVKKRSTEAATSDLPSQSSLKITPGKRKEPATKKTRKPAGEKDTTKRTKTAIGH